jgi:dipeptidyl aminopeptidase/acylaminoacyl peptidase
MNNTKTILLLSFLLFVGNAMGQKRPLDHSVYDSWQTVGSPMLSRTGALTVYTICPQVGDTTLVVRLNRKGTDIKIPRAHRARITDDERHVVCIVKAPYQQRRQARIKKLSEEKRPKDSLAILNVSTGKIRKFPSVASFSMGQRASQAVAFTCIDTSLVPKKERKKKDVGKPLLIHHFANGVTDTILHVKSFTFNRSGLVLAYVVKNKKNKELVGTYNVTTRQKELLTDTLAYCSLPTFSFQGDKMLFLTSTDTASTGSKHCELWKYVQGAGKPQRLLGSADVDGAPKGWSINENARPSFSRNGERIFVGIGEMLPPKDTTIVAFESPSLDIWNYDAPELPPMQKANRSQLSKRTLLGTVKGNRVMALTQSAFDRIRLVNRGDADFVVSIDETPNMVSSQWDIQAPTPLAIVSLSDGHRTPIDTVAYSNLTISPDGKFIAWFDLKLQQWRLYDVAKGQTSTPTASLKVNFWDEENDRPLMSEAYGAAAWTQGSRDLLVYDRYDIWRLPTNGQAPSCLTAGKGRSSKCTYRYIDTKDPDDDPAIKPNERMLLSVFDNVTKKNGYALMTAQRNAAPDILALEGYSFKQWRKAREADVYLYKRGNFEHPMDLYYSTGLGKKSAKLTSINPQQKNYNWGTVELYHWTAYDGTPLDGLLYKPEDFDASKKYPVMIYFYERRSETLYNYIDPQPSWSTINITFYTSRGYVVFVPDIVYKAGIPGECAYNCICSGAESLTRFPWIDKDNMAIQGQSWGGYQVAYLITRTNMFKAAGAGAPVANMTSAYGGIRWESGISRQFQYEQTQSRIGRPLWSAPELYIANSPLFKLPNVTTPVLIMHNDADGAVPWYQGIEMFMGLRRLGKPAWLLEYNNEAHNLKLRRNRKDLTIRLQQFFDFELKGAPEPAWMKHQLPLTRKGQYFGYETE